MEDAGRGKGRKTTAGPALLGSRHAQPPRVPDVGRASAFLVPRFGLKLSPRPRVLVGSAARGRQALQVPRLPVPGSTFLYF